jgi:hypothetical protein
MKKLIIILLWLVILSCNNSSGPISSSDNSSIDAKSVSPNSGADKGTITCLMDGKQKTFHVQKDFFEIPLDVYSKGPNDGLELLDGDRTREGFQFEIKNNGTTKIKNVPGGDRHCIWGYYNSAGVVYAGTDVVVNITSYNQSHLTGTFSGKLLNVNYDGGLGGATAKIAKNYPQYIQITDGKFDLQK